MLQTNIPLVLSGLYFSLTLLWSQLSSIISAILYQQKYLVLDVELAHSKIDAGLMYSVVLGLAAIWILAFSSFLKRINPKYISTFFDTTTGFQRAIHLFRTGDDTMRSDIFGCNTRQWSSIRGEVMTWTRENWTTWVETKPAWFTPNFIATVPDEFIPIEVDPLRRRSSVFESFVGFGSNEGGKGRVKGETNRGRKQASSKVADAPEETGAENGKTTSRA